jgi:biopolymer transport protein ExbD
LTVTLSISEGDNSVNIPASQAAGQEVEQDMEDMLGEEEINNGPVIVQGDSAANFDNFIQLGEGVQNIMLAYYDIDAENPEP